MIPRTAKTSPQLYAKTCGFLYLYIFVAGSFAELETGRGVHETGV